MKRHKKTYQFQTGGTLAILEQLFFLNATFLTNQFATT